MRKDFGLSRLLLFVFIALNTYFLFCSLKLQTETAERHIWNDNFWFYSDWRGVADVEYATNPTAYRYYKGKTATLFRNQAFKQFNDRLRKGESLVVALDYYATMPGACKLPDELLDVYGERLILGEVICFRVKDGGNDFTHWQEIEN